jgi:hypothetical protein
MALTIKLLFNRLGYEYMDVLSVVTNQKQLHVNEKQDFAEKT